MARCHRIGQTKEVRVYRLITKGTYEMHLFATATRKFGLDEAILSGAESHDGGDPEEDAKRLDGLLKLGAVDAFQQGEEAAKEGADSFCVEDIDTILQNRVERREMASRKGNTFSTATFAVGAGDAAAAAGISWEELMPEAMAAAKEKEALGDPRLVVTGKRQRNQVNYNVAELERRAASSSAGGAGGKPGGRKRGGGNDDDDDFQHDSDDSDYADPNAEGEQGEAGAKGKGSRANAANEWSITAVNHFEDAMIRYGAV